MKKLLSILLAAICVFTFTGTVASASADVITNTDIKTGELTEIPDVPEEPLTPTLDDYEYVVTMYLCSTASSFTGHVWLYFVNLTECDVPVGNIMLKPGEEMSVGSMSYFRKGGGGTYYNAEAKMAVQKGIDKVCRNTYSLKMDLTNEQLAKVNKKITDMDFYSYIFCNCGVFATQVWNSVADTGVVHIVLPIFTVLNMMILGAKKGELKTQEVTNVYKQTSNGYEDLGNYDFNTLCV